MLERKKEKRLIHKVNYFTLFGLKVVLIIFLFKKKKLRPHLRYICSYRLSTQLHKIDQLNSWSDHERKGKKNQFNLLLSDRSKVDKCCD